MSRLTGKNVVYTDVSVEALVERLVPMVTAHGMPAAFAAVMADVDRGISVGELADSSGDLARLIGRPVTPWRETLAAAVRALG